MIRYINAVNDMKEIWMRIHSNVHFLTLIIVYISIFKLFDDLRQEHTLSARFAMGDEPNKQQCAFERLRNACIDFGDFEVG